MKKGFFGLFWALALVSLGFGCIGSEQPTGTPTAAAVMPPATMPAETAAGLTGLTFNQTNESVCTKNGKPIIRLYSTTTCLHCIWVKDTFDRTAKEYVDAGEIVAYHWELDIYDDAITPAYEGSIPANEIGLFTKYNPRGTVPTYIFGCKYYRVGNSYEGVGDLAAEEKEFRGVIEELLRTNS